MSSVCSSSTQSAGFCVDEVTAPASNNDITRASSFSLRSQLSNKFRETLVSRIEIPPPSPSQGRALTDSKAPEFPTKLEARKIRNALTSRAVALLADRSIDREETRKNASSRIPSSSRACHARLVRICAPTRTSWNCSLSMLFIMNTRRLLLREN